MPPGRQARAVTRARDTVRRENVHRDEYVVGEEAGFEDRRRPVVDQLAGELDELVDGVVWQIDDDPARRLLWVRIPPTILGRIWSRKPAKLK